MFPASDGKMLERAGSTREPAWTRETARTES